jgi:hypothetical protein
VTVIVHRRWQQMLELGGIAQDQLDVVDRSGATVDTIGGVMAGDSISSGSSGSTATRGGWADPGGSMRPMTVAPPAITGHAWGRITVDGVTYKDVMLMPGEARAWDWNRSGTSHGGGVQPADVRVLLDHGARHVVLSRGRQGRLGMHADTLALLTDRGVTYEVLRTDDAIDRYEQLRAAGEAVGALVHTTC